MSNLYQLVVRKGPKPGRIIPLLTEAISIGRDPIADIAINDPEVSRQHARLVQSNDSYQIEDLGSTNGTFVNGVQIGVTPHQLAHGNEIQLGSGVILVFELAPEEGDEAAADDLSLETAVAYEAPAELSPAAPVDVAEAASRPDPMADPLADLVDMESELDEAFSQDNLAQSDPIPMPPSVPSLQSPPPPARDNNPVRRLMALGAILIFLMLCCCCGFLFFMYQWGGDWLLQQMGMVP